ncbi:selenocysteine insertion sequence-binding protein 2-like isoform 2-T2 [Menidia menidia]
MDKESKLTSAVPEFDRKHHRTTSIEASGPQTASYPFVLPNPHLSEQILRRHWSDVSPKGGGRGGDVSRIQGRPADRCIPNPLPKTSKLNSNSQGKTAGKKSPEASRKGFRGARSAPHAARTSTAAEKDLVAFEVKMADFPELDGVLLRKATPPAVQKASWGPSTESTSPQSPVPASSFKAHRRRSPRRHDSPKTSSEAKPETAVSTAQPAVTSWANIASQPPKKTVTTERTNSLKQSEDTAVHKEEGAPGKKKRKKKKKKNGTEGGEAEPEVLNVPQEPPKFEDEEEFPGLAVALTGTDRFPASSNTQLYAKENQREGGQHPSADPNKEKSPPGKTQNAEKKAQKAEKVSGKKSKAPVQLDIGNMLATLEKKQQSQKAKQDAKPVILSVGGGLPVVPKQPLTQKKLHGQQDRVAHNPLDSTSPLIKKGKQREVPKAKKPTPLKKVILKEREERKQKRLLEERGLLPESESLPPHEDTEEQSDAELADEKEIQVEESEDQLEINDGSPLKGEGDEEAEQQVIAHPANAPQIHSRKFRDYCNQMLQKDVDECVTTLLKELVRFQDRLYQKDPMKARMKRRIVMGLREVLKHLKLKKVKCVIISPNCERIQSKGGLDEALQTIIDTCREQGVPFVFALSRKTLGRCVNKAVPVSLVGIFNYDGAQDYYHKMIELSSEARRAYEEIVSTLRQSGQPETQQDANGVLEERNPSPDGAKEPEYMKVWKNLLEKECNHAFLNFAEQLNCMHLDSECAENTQEEKS